MKEIRGFEPTESTQYYQKLNEYQELHKSYQFILQHKISQEKSASNQEKSRIPFCLSKTSPLIQKISYKYLFCAEN